MGIYMIQYSTCASEFMKLPISNRGIKETLLCYPPCTADGSKPKPSIPSEGVGETRLARAKSSLAISAHHSGATSTGLCFRLH